PRNVRSSSFAVACGPAALHGRASGAGDLLDMEIRAVKNRRSVWQGCDRAAAIEVQSSSDFGRNPGECSGMRFLVVGACRWSWYQQAFSGALAKLGHESREFGWAQFFLDGHEQQAKPKSFSARLQDRVIAGPLVLRMNRRLVEETLRFRP